MKLLYTFHIMAKPNEGKFMQRAYYSEGTKEKQQLSYR